MKCDNCKHLHTRMVHSGMNPLYRAYCKHPEKITINSLEENEGRFIQKNSIDIIRPSWCPGFEVE